jgi:peptidoglycan/LPS O-acetylase OafA/YrhL
MNGRTSRHIPRLDAMRAMAVTFVLVFHLAPDLIPWGYVGVDMFFCLSGFLMTWLALGEAATGQTFLARRFLSRRFWRIFPSLAWTVLATLAVGMFLLAPAHLTSTAESGLAASFAVANIHFFGEAGYFDSDAAIKPLLHTWSLGVEEQYYLLFATLLAVLSIRRIVPVLAGLFAISIGLLVVVLAANLTGAGPVLHDDPLAALFYLPQYRMFQFAAGGLVAVAVFRVGHAPAWCAASGATVLALGCGVAAVPDIGAALAPLPVTLGMCLLMARSEWLDRVSGVGAIRYVSRVSYQLYLVHWPVIVFIRYIRLEPLGPIEIVVATLLTFVLGHALYWMTEPLRAGHTSATTPRMDRA